MAIHKLQMTKQSDNRSRYFLTLPKSIVEGLGWKKGYPINVELTTKFGDIKLLLEHAKEE